MAITLATTLPLGTDLQNEGQNASGGTTIGSSTSELISFYGVTAVAQQSGSGQTAVSTSALTTVSGTGAISVSLNDGYAFNQTQANNLLTLAAETKTRLSATITLVNQLRSDLQDLGLIAGS